MRIMGQAAIGLAGLALAGCASGSASGTKRTVVAPSPAPVLAGPVKPPVAPQPRAGQLLGETAEKLAARFGTARIDLTEDIARKLQFASENCVLDIYLYPAQAGPERIATHLAARRRNGEDIDPASCITEIEQR